MLVVLKEKGVDIRCAEEFALWLFHPQEAMTEKITVNEDGKRRAITKM
jgi:hypothetical protein